PHVSRTRPPGEPAPAPDLDIWTTGMRQPSGAGLSSWPLSPRRQPSSLEAADAGERPAWLDLGPAGPVFTVLHAPARPGGSAVLVCPPFGWREECAHRALATWARALAAAGFPTLRLELPGTRNSAGGPAERRLPIWQAAIVAAASWLREHAGAERVTLLGLELGGLAGWAAAADGGTIDDLILWGVPALGAAAVRELRMEAAVVSARYADEEGDERSDDRLQLVGYVLDGAALGEFAALEPLELPLSSPSARRALLLHRDSQTVDPALVDRLRARGVETTVSAGPGYAPLMADPQFSRTPSEAISTTIAWLARHDAARRRDAVSQRSQAASPANGAPHVDIGLRVGDEAIRERVVSLRGDGPMFAIVSEPVDAERAPICAILLNAGSVSHTGPNRAWVEAARRWAARGITSVRVDFPGIGETVGDHERFADTNVYYDQELIAHTVGLLDGLQELGLPPRFALAGLCSGSYWALHAALADPRVCGAMLLNLWAFYFTPELVLERAPGDAVSRLRHGGVGRLVRGDFSRERLGRALRNISPSGVISSTRRPIERSQSADIAADIAKLDERGVALTLLFSAGEPLPLQLERQGLIAQLDRWPHLRIERVPSRDHMFRSPALQGIVHGQLDRALERALERATEGQRVEEGDAG
ncbi:MAG: hypothetical protein ACRDL5_02265, partial [Solirubrobacteraceae bacterium]